MGELTARALFEMNDTALTLLSEAEKINKNFYHYTTEQSARSIFTKDANGNCYFWLRNIATMADQDERELHSSNGTRIHCFSMCHTKHEQIPLWYLYSGINGRGVRIGIPPKNMLNLLRSIETVFPVVGGKVDCSKPLKKNEDFQLQCGWVYYVMDGNNRVLYRSKTYAVEALDEATMSTNCFIKKYPWKYESEFRIIVINNSNAEYVHIAVPIPEKNISAMSIMSAPEYAFSQSDVLFYESVGISKKKIYKSKLKIKMNLLERHREDILSDLDQWCTDDSCSCLCTHIRKNKRCSAREEQK